jgi:hypothetical protein
MSNILKGIQLNEVDPRNFDSDWDYYDALNRKPRGRSEDDYEDPALKYEPPISAQKKVTRPKYEISDDEDRQAGYNMTLTVTAPTTQAAEWAADSYVSNEWGAKKQIGKIEKVADGVVQVRMVDNHKYGMWKPWKDEPAIHKPISFNEEQLDELSPETLDSYKKKASAQASELDKAAWAGQQPTQQRIEKANKRYSGIIGATKRVLGIKENAEELNMGDPVVVTGDVQFNGATGDIVGFSNDKHFVIVDLYNHGKRSFHSSDVSFNDYADSDDEHEHINRVKEGKMKDIAIGKQDHDDMNPQLFHGQYGQTKTDWEGQFSSLLNPQKKKKKASAPKSTRELDYCPTCQRGDNRCVCEDMPPPENARKTQIAGTLPTYKKAADILNKTGVQGKALDFGAGLGMGTAELGKDAHSYEPFPNEKFKPHFVDVTKIPDNSYHKIVNLNVLNVVPNTGEHKIRDSIVKNIGRVLAPGGVALITTRGKDVLTIKGTPGEEPTSMISKIGTYQKGFTQRELLQYIQQTLGKGFEVSSIRLGPAGVMIKKLDQQPVSEGYDEEELANEVYAEFERIYPNLARRANERTVHAAIMDVLNYGGDSNPSALAQDVARAVKRDIEQGVAEGQLDEISAATANQVRDKREQQYYDMMNKTYGDAQAPQVRHAQNKLAQAWKSYSKRAPKKGVEESYDLEAFSGVKFLNPETGKMGTFYYWSSVEGKNEAYSMITNKKLVPAHNDGTPMTWDEYKQALDGGNQGVAEDTGDNKFDAMMSKVTSKKSLHAREALGLMDELIYQGGATYEEALEQASMSFEIDPAKLDQMYQQQAGNLEEEGACWKNYKQIGMKPGKNGKPVPDCRGPIKETKSNILKGLM